MLNQSYLKCPKYWLFSMLFLWLSIALQADTKIDSLHQLALRATNSTQKIAHYKSLFEQLDKTRDKKVLAYAQELIAFSKEKNLPIGQGFAYRYMGLYQVKGGETQQALEDFTLSRDYFLAANELAEAINSLLNMEYTYSRLGQVEKQKAILQQADSLVQYIDSPTTKGNLYRAKANFSKRQGNTETTLQNYDLALEQYQLADNQFNRAKVLLDKGQFIVRSNPEDAISLYQEAIRIAEKLNEINFLLYANGGLSSAYNRLGNYYKAISITHEELRLAEKIDDKMSIFNATVALGEHYSHLTDSVETLNYYQKSINLAKKMDYPFGEMLGYHYMGLHFWAAASYQKALFYLKRGLAIAEKLERKDIIMEMSSYLGRSYVEIDSLEQGLQYLKRIEQLNTDNNPAYSKDAHEGLGFYYLKTKNYPQAAYYGQLLYDFGNARNFIAPLTNATKILYEANKYQGKIEAALNWLEKYKEYSDQARDESKLKQITTLKLSNEFDKEKEVLVLAQLQKEQLLQAETQRAYIVIFAIALLALLVFGFLWQTRRKNRIIQQQNTELEQLNAAKDQLFAIIGHDLRKPALAFRGISRKINYLLQRQAFEKLNRMGDQLEKSAFALNGLLDNLLNWALQQRNVLPYSPQRFSVQEATEEIYHLFQSIATDKEVSLEMNIPPEISVFSDANAFSTIVRNLVDNAIKFTPEGGTVSLTAEQIEKQIKLSVTDTGIGIAPEKIPQLFELQANKSTHDTEGVKSSGLGLTLVRELVELNQGTIELFSTLGKGTRFEVFLPQ